MMKITIHRGANQIGGCITEIATATTRIFIDLGHNLPNNEGTPDALANKESVQNLTNGVDAIFYTHYHGDHVDLFKYVPKNIPQYIGEVAKQVMLCKYKRLSDVSKIEVTPEDVEVLKSFKTFQAARKITIGDITVTPFFVSHSAYDAYMFLVEADGKRILHTGDFRQHGYLGKGLIRVIKELILPKGAVDYLIIEGTMLSRPNEKVKTEQEIQQEATRLMKQYKYVFVLCSSTDIDRLASFYQASQSNGRSFLVDDYQKEVLDIFTATAGTHTSCFQFNNIYFYNQKTAAQFALIKNKGFCMPIRSKHLPHLEKLLKLPKEQTLLIYSMWSGYLADGKNPNQGYVDIWDSFTNKEKLHTSGHATCETLEEVCNLIKPTTAIIPIHSEQSQAFKDLKIAEDLKSKIVISALGRDDIDIRIGCNGNQISEEEAEAIMEEMYKKAKEGFLKRISSKP